MTDGIKIKLLRQIHLFTATGAASLETVNKCISRNNLIFVSPEFWHLTHFSPVSHFYTPWKRQKTLGGIEMWHWTKMD